MHKFTRVATIVVLSVLTVVGCHRKAAQRPAPSRINADSLLREQARLDSVARAEAARAAASAAATAAANAGPVTAAPVSNVERTALAATIYFDLDEAALTDEARNSVEAKAPVLLRHPNLRIRIAGHADAQGSDEYNLALGLRRAAETKRYLAALGVDESRIEIVTFGEEKPAVQGNTQEAYALNRRCEFEIIAGG
ncbi:MAG TPA: OmpA family protein [Gemmatimonadaceae bacterium]|nr:OmpA family protein [Gemmatimonadaceae bacterium]